MQNYWIHPEIQEEEIFLSNMNDEQFEALRWSSKRKGNSAYNGEGRKLNFSNWFPVFIQERELVKRKVDLRELRRELREKS